MALPPARQQFGSRLEVPQRRPVPHAAPPRPINEVDDHSADYYFYFHIAAREKECKSYTLHRKIRGRAVDKNAQREYKDPHDNKDWNCIFPPSVIERQCNAAVVRELLDCNCRICGNFIVDPTEDASLISEVESNREVRFSIAALAYMGAGFAIRLLWRCGLGKNGFSLSTRLELPSLQQELFGPLQREQRDQREPKIREFLHHGLDRSLEQMAAHFSRFYEETRMLLRSPKLKANMATTDLQGCNLPFLHESSLSPQHPHVSSLTIHAEYRDDSMPVRLSSLPRGTKKSANQSERGILSERDFNVLLVSTMSLPALRRISSSS